MPSFTKTEKLEILETAVTWIVVMAMFVYGAAKFVQFEGAAKLDKTVAELTGMELMWAFYGFSKPFALTLGVLEIMGAFLMLFKKTRLIGCLFTSTILVNIILQDVFYGVNKGALRAAIWYQLCILLILVLNKEQLIAGIRQLVAIVKTQQTKQRWMVKLLLAFLIFAVLRVFEYYISTTASL